MKRNEHLFQFPAAQVAEAAKAEWEYHTRRIAYWKEERTKAIEAIKAQAVKIEVREYPASGGGVSTQVTTTIDMTLTSRINTCDGKINQHVKDADRFKIEADAYGSQAQARFYEMSPEDVVYFRLAGGPREE